MREEQKANTERVYKDVEFLTSLVPARNFQNLRSLEKSFQYIKEEFEKAGAATEVQSWLAQGEEYKNVIASYNPNSERRLVVGAHYDVCGDQPGADDNGSAVAGLLETARLVFQNKPEID